jgi:hypothetical protein
MFTVEIRVNGNLVAHVYGQNLSEYGIEEAAYRWEYYEVSSQTVRCGHVKHVRSQGIAPLVAKILTKVSKEKVKLPTPATSPHGPRHS